MQHHVWKGEDKTSSHDEFVLPPKLACCGRMEVNMSKKHAVVLLLVILSAGLTACGQDVEYTSNNTPVLTQKPTEKPATAHPRNLKGITILVGNWGTSSLTEIKTQKQLDKRAYHAKLEKEHNFTLKQVYLGSWPDYKKIVVTSIMADDPAADIFILDQAMVSEPIKQGLCYPVSDLESFHNFKDTELWNQGIKKAYTLNGKTYGFSEEKDSPGLGVFWNKRLFKEAGLDPNLLYDLQSNCEWTWDKLHELAKQLTIVKKGNKTPKSYGICAWQSEFVKAAVFSNGSDYIKYNHKTKQFENNQQSKDFVSAVKLGVDLCKEGIMMPQSKSSDYDSNIKAFKNGKAAMYVAEWYRNSQLKDMKDDWGFVFFPVGSGKNAKMQTLYSGNVKIIPSCLNAERADDIAYAYSKWVGTVPGYENEICDLSNYYSLVRDTRSVDETIVPMLNGQGVHSRLYMIPGLSFKYAANEENGGLGAGSADTIAKKASARFSRIINKFYKEDE